jgi:hypothetical protein
MNRYRLNFRPGTMPGWNSPLIRAPAISKDAGAPYDRRLAATAASEHPKRLTAGPHQHRPISTANPQRRITMRAVLFAFFVSAILSSGTYAADEAELVEVQSIRTSTNLSCGVIVIFKGTEKHFCVSAGSTAFHLLLQAKVTGLKVRVETITPAWPAFPQVSGVELP